MSNHSKYPTDPKLREALIEFRQLQGLTNSVLAQRFATTATLISEYINDRLQRCPKDFEARAWNTLAALKGRLEDATNYFETTVSKNIHGRLEMARKTQDVVLIVGMAGEGKSCGGRMFAAANAGTLYLELSSHQRTDRQVAGAIFNMLERRSDWKGNMSRAEFLTNQLRNSHRVIIIDEAHLLDMSGRQFLFSLNRDTGCAIALIGNPEILDKIRKNDQHFSRVGVKGEPMLTDKEIPEVALKVATQFSSEEFAAKIDDLVAFVASKPGRLRAVRKGVILAWEMSQKNGTEPRKAFRSAHKNLVRDYELPGD